LSLFSLASLIGEVSHLTATLFLIGFDSFDQTAPYILASKNIKFTICLINELV